MIEIIRRTQYRIRPMQERDIPQALEIDREAFPTQWPYPTYSSFKQELQNRLAYYSVVYKPNDDYPEEYSTENRNNQKTFFDKIIDIFNPPQNTGNSKLPPSKNYIIGMAGFWLMAGEVHIITIAVRDHYRNQGIGSGMLIHIIDSALALNAKVVTLEVRMSNNVAQQVYKKFGFKPAGIRHKYYTDNNENALIMTTDNINYSDFLSRLKFIRESHQQTWGAFISE
jgi:ribosomal-protein-alanine N-acetyltransferase